jgi:hypothetical protein
MSFGERRQSVRHAVERCTALFRRKRLFFFWGKQPDRAPIVDLSSHGIGFYTKCALHPGDVIRIAFDAPDDCAVPPGFEVMAEVRWANPAQGEPGSLRVGCAFRGLKSEQQDIIARIIRFGVVRQG